MSSSKSLGKATFRPNPEETDSVHTASTSNGGLTMKKNACNQK